MKTIRVGVTGGRNYLNPAHVYETLSNIKRKIESVGCQMMLVVGDATGADASARHWANHISYCDMNMFRANWGKHGNAAGPIRNQEMLDSGIDYLCVFPGGRGTADMKKRCEERGVKTMEYIQL